MPILNRTKEERTSTEKRNESEIDFSWKDGRKKQEIGFNSTEGLNILQEVEQEVEETKEKPSRTKKLVDSKEDDIKEEIKESTLNGNVDDLERGSNRNKKEVEKLKLPIVDGLNTTNELKEELVDFNETKKLGEEKVTPNVSEIGHSESTSNETKKMTEELTSNRTNKQTEDVVIVTPSIIDDANSFKEETIENKKKLQVAEHELTSTKQKNELKQTSSYNNSSEEKKQIAPNKTLNTRKQIDDQEMSANDFLDRTRKRIEQLKRTIMQEEIAFNMSQNQTNAEDKVYSIKPKRKLNDHVTKQKSTFDTTVKSSSENIENSTRYETYKPNKQLGSVISFKNINLKTENSEELRPLNKTRKRSVPESNRKMFGFFLSDMYARVTDRVGQWFGRRPVVL